MDKKNFAIIGVGGYIAKRHLQAVKDIDGNLLASVDKHDSVGIIDSYFPNSDFFFLFERFDRHIEKLRRMGKQLDYVSICSPNYLHDAHIRFTLRVGADAICEKPIVLNPWNVDGLKEIENESGQNIYTILQLRLHPSIVQLKEKIQKAPKDKTYDLDLTYITSRGNWYMVSWKGDMPKSGGVATNIGVHFFDMLAWIFGDVKENLVHISKPEKASGTLKLEKANVRWFLSVDYNDIPEKIKKTGKRTYRSITMDGEEIEFSEGFTDLHTKSYQEILNGNGFNIEDARKSIEIVHKIRNMAPLGLKGEYHPLCKFVNN